MSTADYTNDRWHVDGPIVTHDDFPGSRWNVVNRDGAEDRAQLKSSLYVTTHAARAWLAAQPKPTIKAGMRVEATLRGGAVVTGKVTSVTDCGDYITVRIGPGVTCFTDFTPAYQAANDITDWHEVTA